MPATSTTRDDEVRAWAPGRVNLMGDHTDQTGGRVLPMAIDLGTTVVARRGGVRVALQSDWAGAPDAAEVPIDVDDPRGAPPGWARLVAAVVASVRPEVGITGSVSSTLPIGAGLSSSAALEVALALALGFDGAPRALAELAQRAEQAATGVPCGIMDQLASVAGAAGHALRIDCHDLTTRPVPLPTDLDVLVVHSGEHRTLAATPYAARVQDLVAAEAVVGPLRAVALADLSELTDPQLRRRARHVVTENGRVDELIAALGAADRAVIGEVLAASHASLRDDLEVSTRGLDDLVAELTGTPGVLGARCTGAGFGGCVVALADAGTPLPAGREAWRVRAADGATCVAAGRPSWPRTPRR